MTHAGSLTGLNTLNRVLAVVGGVFAIAVASVAHRAQTLPVVWVRSQMEAATNTTQTLPGESAQTVVVVSTLVTSVPIAYLLALFLALHAFDHYWVGWPGKDAYERNLHNRMNPVRWLEYAASASVMNVVIAMEVGLNDITMLVGMMGLTAGMILCGHVAEHERDVTYFWLGCIPFLLQWACIIAAFMDAVQRGDPPDFVHAIVWVLFGLESLFAVAQMYQQRWLWVGHSTENPTTQFMEGEKVFCLLSALAKYSLAALTLGFTFR